MTSKRRPRAVVRIMGGLGNQLFQVAHALDLRATGMEVAVDTSWFRRRPTSDTPRELDVVPELAGLRAIRLPSLVWSPRLRMAHPEGGRPARLSHLGLPALQYGYWQSWAAVERVQLPMNDFLDRLQELHRIPAVAHSDYVAVHARLGDYLTQRASGYHGVTDPLQQLQLALEMAERIGARSVRVFTDSRDALPAEFARTTAVQIDDSATAVEALIRMSGASGIVMSNSSLSWWAAARASWLSPESADIAVPIPWLRDPSGLDSALPAPNWSPYHRRILGR